MEKEVIERLEGLGILKPLIDMYPEGFYACFNDKHIQCADVMKKITYLPLYKNNDSKTLFIDKKFFPEENFFTEKLGQIKETIKKFNKNASK